MTLINEHVGPMILAKIKIYVFTRAELLFQVCYDTPCSNQVRVVAVSLPQLTQASFLQKNQTLQNRFLISVTLRWHRVSVACKIQSF